MSVDKIDENSMDIDENQCSLVKDCLRSNFGSVTGNNGFSRNAPNLDQCKPGSVKKLVIKNLKGKSSHLPFLLPLPFPFFLTDTNFSFYRKSQYR